MPRSDDKKEFPVLFNFGLEPCALKGKADKEG